MSLKGITHLDEVILRGQQKDGTFIENLFNSNVRITENLDGSRVLARIDDDNNFILYKKDISQKITKIDTTLSLYWEQLFTFFDNIDDSIKAQLPRNFIFGFEYFINDNPCNIKYDRLPKNNLVILFIHEFEMINDNIKVIKHFKDRDTLTNWADILDVEHPPIIFEGKLSRTQCNKIVKYLMEYKKNLNTLDHYKHESFPKFLMDLLELKKNPLQLSNTYNSEYDSIVFTFLYNDKEIIGKIPDPKNIEHKSLILKQPSDLYYLLLVQIIEFFNFNKPNSFKLKQKTSELRYIEFVNNAFFKFYEKNKKDIVDIDFETPHFLTKKFFKLNFKNINDDKIVSMLQNDLKAIEIYKIFLNALRKKRSKPISIMNDSIIKTWNSIVQDIFNHVQNIEKPKPIVESTDFKIDVIDDDKEDSDDNETESKNNVSMLKIVSAIQTLFPNGVKKDEHSTIKKVKGKQNVIVITGNFQPIVKEHVKSAIKEAKENKMKIIFCPILSNDKSKNPFDEKTVNSYLSAIINSNVEHFINDIKSTKRNKLKDIISLFNDTSYNPAIILSDEKRIDNYEKQFNFLSKSDELSIVFKSYKKTYTPYDAKEMLYAKDFNKFKEIVPKELITFYDVLTTDVQNNCTEVFSKTKISSKSINFDDPKEDNTKTDTNKEMQYDTADSSIFNAASSNEKK